MVRHNYTGRRAFFTRSIGDFRTRNNRTYDKRTRARDFAINARFITRNADIIRESKNSEGPRESRARRIRESRAESVDEYGYYVPETVQTKRRERDGTVLGGRVRL